MLMPGVWHPWDGIIHVDVLPPAAFIQLLCPLMSQLVKGSGHAVAVQMPDKCAAPLVLMTQDAYGGFADQRIVEDFAYYADAVFAELGQHVQSWVTFNEPLVVCETGYKIGQLAMR